MAVSFSRENFIAVPLQLNVGAQAQRNGYSKETVSALVSLDKKLAHILTLRAEWLILDEEQQSQFHQVVLGPKEAEYVADAHAAHSLVEEEKAGRLAARLERWVNSWKDDAPGSTCQEPHSQTLQGADVKKIQ